MDYNSKYTGEQVEELLDKINKSPEDIATPSGEYPDMTVGKASKAGTADTATNIENAPILTTVDDKQITVQVGDKTSDPITVPYAASSDSAKNLEEGTMHGQTNSQDIKPIEDSTYQLGDSTHKYKNVFSDFFTGNLKGNAKTATDLTGRIEATPEVFTYRPSAGEKSIKDDNAFIRRVKGNSVVWNQMCDFTNGVFTFGESFGIKDAEGYTITTNESSTTRTIFQFSSPIPFYSHKWLAIATIKSPIKVNIKGMPTQGFVPNTKCDIYSFYESAEGNWYWGLTIESVGTISEIKVYNYLLFDLTQMFGVGNEPTTVEEFRELYPNSYYPYNTGELHNLDCSGIKTVGFNQWDEQWEYGNIDSYTGVTTALSNCIRSTNFIPVIGGKSYYFSKKDGAEIGLYAYDDTYNFIGVYDNDDFAPSAGTTKVTNKSIQLPTNAKYIKFRVYPYTTSTSVNDICINLHHTGWRDGDYEPYKEFTHSLPLSQITNGEPLRKAGEVYDEINEAEYIKRVGVRSYTEGDEDNNTLLTDGVITNYPLAEPIVTPIETPIDFNYYVEDFGTEEALLAEDSAPFSADIVYQFNATDQIRNNSRNIDKLQKSAFTPRGTSAQYIRGDGSYGDRFELSQSTPINDGEYEMPDAIHQFILTPNYYAKSSVKLDNSTTVTVCVTPPEDSHYLAKYWFEFAVDETLPNIEYYQPNNSEAVFRIDGDMMTDAVNILHLISSDGGNTFFGEIKNYSL